MMNQINLRRNHHFVTYSTYIFSYSGQSFGICVKPDSPFKTLPDLIEHARKNPGNLSYSTPGTGGGVHIAIEYLARQAKVKFKHVPFKGGAPASTALIGGHVDFMGGAGTHLPFVKQGVMRMLAVFEQKEPQFPDIPVIEELGYKSIPTGSFVLLAPKGLPDPIFKKIESTFKKSAYSPEFQKMMGNIGLPFIFEDRRQFEAKLAETYKLYADFLKEIDLSK
jgi:tripartite-type tricarboxylate transporter receptor subunit TctC